VTAADRRRLAARSTPGREAQGARARVDSNAVTTTTFRAILARALPLAASELSARRAAVVRGAALALVGLWVVYFAYVLTAPGLGAEGFFRTYVFSGLPVLAAVVCLLRAWCGGAERTSWALLGTGMLLWAGGSIYWSVALKHLEAPPYPSVGDALYLGFYPACYAALMLLAGPRVRGIGRSVWLDGLIAMLAVSAVGAAFLIPAVVTDTSGDTAVVATNLAYPLGDLLLIALVVGGFALTSWQPGRAWALIGGGLLLFAVADVGYLYVVAHGTFVEGSWLDTIWPAGMALIAIAAWQKPPRSTTHRADGWPVLAIPLPLVLTLASVGVLVYGNVADINLAALICAGATVVSALLRLALSFREVRALADSRRQATTDELTGLPNRRYFYERLREELAVAEAQGSPLTLLIADLDGFKELNDTLGHHAGDLLLQQIGPRLLDGLRGGDTLARLGGDEFAVLLPGCDSDAAVDIVEQIRVILDEPFVIRGLNLHAAASVGIAAFPQHADDGDALVRRADVAMYQAKESQSGWQIYVAERDLHSRDRLQLMGDLRRAIDEHQLEIHYQPKLDLGTDVVTGVEALVRWRHPTRGLLGPMQFIPLAERTALMRPLTLCVLDGALQQSRRWRDDGLDLSVAVNLSVPNLLDTKLPGDVQELLTRWDVPADRLILEVTENVILADPARVIEILTALKEIGVSLSLDDFGTGSSALSYLKRLPVDELKIDKSFVIAMESSPADAAIVRSTTELAQRLGLRVVAEGVETEVALAQLGDAGCEEVQGYFLQRPVPAAEIAPWIAARARGAHAPT
jgi:diguanylate cyclase (GGDEF)-like protein